MQSQVLLSCDDRPMILKLITLAGQITVPPCSSSITYVILSNVQLCVDCIGRLCSVMLLCLLGHRPVVWSLAPMKPCFLSFALMIVHLSADITSWHWMLATHIQRSYTPFPQSNLHHWQTDPYRWLPWEPHTQQL